MGFFSEDMAPMLGVFEAETSELMAAYDSIISRVERSGAFSPEDIAELFRCAHTTKGSSAMMGLDSLASLTHKVEDLFDLLRGNPGLAEGHVPDIIDDLYSFSDFMKDELARMGDDDYAPADVGELVAAIATDVAMLGGDAEGDGCDRHAKNPDAMCPDEHSSPSVDEESPEPDEFEEGAQTVTFKVRFKPDVAMVNARAMVVMKQLGGQVQVLSHGPADLAAADAAQLIERDGLLVCVSADDADEARRFLSKNSFIRQITTLDAETSTQATSAGKQAAEPAPASDKFVTLRWNDMQELQDMAGEFLLHAAHLKELVDQAGIARELRAAVSQASQLADELVYRVNRMSMVGMSAMVPQLSRIVRDMCRSSGKQVSFDVRGGDIEIDRNLYNSILDPLIHIIRNAVDHGIESPEERLSAGKDARGNVTLSIENLGARVAFRITDDGRGVDTAKVLAKAEADGMLDRPAHSYTRQEALQLVMMAGLSTKQEVTQYSGRGVGLDVVGAVVREFDGRITIDSEPGAGTSVTLFMPVSVTSVESLGFKIGPSVYYLALSNLSKIYTANEAAELVSEYAGATLFTVKKSQIPVLDMHRLLGCPGEDAFYIACRSMDDEFVIGVDGVLGEFACASKPLPPCLGDTWQTACPVRNATVLSDGTVGYALNAPMLADLAHGRKEPTPPVDEPDVSEMAEPLEVATAEEIPTGAFVFELGNDRYAIPVEQVERLVPMPACAPAPMAPPHLMGLANYRNQAIPVFDLAGSAGADGERPYALVTTDEDGEHRGLAISSAVGVISLEDARLADEQPEPRPLAAGLYSAALLSTGPKEPPVYLLK